MQSIGYVARLQTVCKPHKKDHTPERSMKFTLIIPLLMLTTMMVHAGQSQVGPTGLDDNNGNLETTATDIVQSYGATYEYSRDAEPGPRWHHCTGCAWGTCCLDCRDPTRPYDYCIVSAGSNCRSEKWETCDDCSILVRNKSCIICSGCNSAECVNARRLIFSDNFDPDDLVCTADRRRRQLRKRQW